MYKLIITKEVQNEIDYLHNKIKGEWSGILAYTPKTLIGKDGYVFETVGIYLKDIGSSVSTEFNYKDITKINTYFQKEFPGIPVLFGSIHTHHTMGAFISGTDSAEIEKNTQVFNNYLFLVVDAIGGYEARFGRKVISLTKTVDFIGLDGKKVTQEINSEEKSVKVFNVTIETPHLEITVSKTFEKLYEKVKKEKEKRVVQKSVIWGAPNSFGYEDFYGGSEITNNGSRMYKTKTSNTSSNRSMYISVAENVLYNFFYGHPLEVEEIDVQYDIDEALLDGLSFVDEDILHLKNGGKIIAESLEDSVETVLTTFQGNMTVANVLFQVERTLNRLEQLYDNQMDRGQKRVLKLLLKACKK